MTENQRLSELFNQIQVLKIENERLCEQVASCRQTESRFQTLLNSIKEGYFEVNLKGDFTFFSPSICKMSGFSAEELRGKNYRDYTSKETAEKIFQFYNHIYLTADPSEIITYETFRKDGTTLYLEVSAYLMRDSKGNPSGFKGFCRDVTDRKKIEIELQESQERFRQLHEASFGGIGIHDKGKILECNKGLSDITGFDYDELIGMDGLALIAPEWRDKVMANILSDYEKPYVVEGIRKDGSRYPLEIQGKVIWYEGRKARVTEFRDITERKQAEKAQRESEEKYRMVLDNIEDGYYEVDVAGNLIFFNDSLCRILGYSRSELMNMNNKEFMDPENARRIFQTFNRVFITGKPSKAFDWEFVKKDGTKCCVDTSVSPIKDADGKVIGFRGIARDITDRRLAEIALRESEERFKAQYDGAPVPTFTWRKREDDFELISYNKAAMEITGGEVGKYLGKRAGDLYRNRGEVLQNFYQCLEEKKVVKDELQSEHFIPGRIVIATYAFVPPDLILVHIEDITERKAAEEALKRSQDQYREVVENANDAIIIVQDGMIVFHNTRAETLTGYSKKELAETPFASFVVADDRDVLLGRYEDKLNGKKFGSAFAFGITDKKGNDLWVEVNTVLISWKGRPALQCFIRDVTFQKKLETQLHQAYKMEAIGTLAGGIAHDFNNIIGIILGNTELAIYDVAEWSPAHKNLETVRNACFRARDIVRQILSFSRQNEQERNPLILESIVKESLKMLRSSLPTTIDIQEHIRTAGDMILADPAQIHQVIINLCTNAAHAMKENGGIIEVGLEDAALDETSARQYPGLLPGQYMRLIINDTGEGIDPKIIDRIFDPYFTTKKIGEGSGMGLAIVHRIIKNHSGAITVYSEPGRGTTFKMLFPKVEIKQAPQKEIPEEPPKGKEKILYVDDETSLAEIGQQMLNIWVYEVESKTNPVDALKTFEADPQAFDLVITDMTMPQMTGKMLAQELIRIRPDIPVILNSGYSDQMDEEKAKELGIKAYILKPLNTMNLAKTIRNVLNNQ